MKAGKHLLILTIFIFLGMLLSACGNKIEKNMSEPMAEFSFTTQDEYIISLDDLKDEWWITYFSYTNCRTVCPRTTANMVDVQSELKEDNLHPKIISFNVDPANDTPKDLKEYAEEYGVDLSTWDFLTGYDFETIQEISKNSFHAVLEAGAADQMAHSYMFYLVNPEGEVVKKYDGMSMDELDTLIEDVKIVMK
ncbi:SCO family protein [Virgibacillus sp. CBA3643]|uniref:SCO family protein n=1 Tax=Virgibacillus sp. CBA3643 TaxID=2942278 RepID=UPI0035A3C263